MYEFLSHNALYLVLAIVLICWMGILGYLFRIDKKLTHLEQNRK